MTTLSLGSWQAACDVSKANYQHKVSPLKLSAPYGSKVLQCPVLICAGPRKMQHLTAPILDFNLNCSLSQMQASISTLFRTPQTLFAWTLHLSSAFVLPHHLYTYDSHALLLHMCLFSVQGERQQALAHDNRSGLPYLASFYQ